MIVDHCYFCGDRRFRLQMQQVAMKTPHGMRHEWLCSHHVSPGMLKLWCEIRDTYPIWYRQQIQDMMRRLS